MSFRILLYYQTFNLFLGQTTCERFAKTHYKVQHEMSKEIIEMEFKIGSPTKRRMQTLAVNDFTSQTDSLMSNCLGMCT